MREVARATQETTNDCIDYSQSSSLKLFVTIKSIIWGHSSKVMTILVLRIHIRTLDAY